MDASLAGSAAWTSPESASPSSSSSPLHEVHREHVVPALRDRDGNGREEVVGRGHVHALVHHRDDEDRAELGRRRASCGPSARRRTRASRERGERDRRAAAHRVPSLGRRGRPRAAAPAGCPPARSFALRIIFSIRSCDSGHSPFSRSNQGIASCAPTLLVEGVPELGGDARRRAQPAAVRLRTVVAQRLHERLAILRVPVVAVERGVVAVPVVHRPGAHPLAASAPAARSAPRARAAHVSAPAPSSARSRRTRAARRRPRRPRRGPRRGACPARPAGCSGGRRSCPDRRRRRRRRTGSCRGGARDGERGAGVHGADDGGGPHARGERERGGEHDFLMASSPWAPRSRTASGCAAFSTAPEVTWQTDPRSSRARRTSTRRAARRPAAAGGSPRTRSARSSRSGPPPSRELVARRLAPGLAAGDEHLRALHVEDVGAPRPVGEPATSRSMTSEIAAAMARSFSVAS